MSGVFEKSYAKQYDALYGEKDYRAECDAVEELFRRFGSAPVRTLLDLGCGTGTHALMFAERGHLVTGVDRSPHMLKLARAKRTTGELAPEFLEGDIRSLALGQRFDAVLMLFAVLGYQTTEADMAAAMESVARHLKPGGLFVCDVWYGPAVLAVGTSNRLKLIDTPGGTLHRTSAGVIDTTMSTCRVNFRTWHEVGGHVTDESVEEHTMRYFFPQDLDRFFGDAGLELCSIRPFESLDTEVGPGTWNVWVCGRTRRLK